MKRELLATTALIAAGMLASGGSAYAQANGPAQLTAASIVEHHPAKATAVTRPRIPGNPPSTIR